MCLCSRPVCVYCWRFFYLLFLILPQIKIVSTQIEARAHVSFSDREKIDSNRLAKAKLQKQKTDVRGRHSLVQSVNCKIKPLKRLIEKLMNTHLVRCAEVYRIYVNLAISILWHNNCVCAIEQSNTSGEEEDDVDRKKKWSDEINRMWMCAFFCAKFLGNFHASNWRKDFRIAQNFIGHATNKIVSLVRAIAIASVFVCALWAE